MSSQPFVIERTYNAPITLVWEALTNEQKMREWYFDVDTFSPVVGCEFSFGGCTADGTNYTHRCRVTEVIPGRKVAYTWTYEGYPGESVVTFELFAEGNNTRLLLTHSGLESFGITNPDFAPHNFASGWTHIIGTGLPEYLARTSC